MIILVDIKILEEQEKKMNLKMKSISKLLESLLKESGLKIDLSQWQVCRRKGSVGDHQKYLNIIQMLLLMKEIVKTHLVKMDRILRAEEIAKVMMIKDLQLVPRIDYLHK